MRAIVFDCSALHKLKFKRIGGFVCGCCTSWFPRTSGVWATDIVDYKLPTDPLDDVDLKRLYELQKDPRYKDPLWRREIKTFMKIKRKAEQEAFSRYDLTYIVDEYLPNKLEETK